MAPSGVDPSEGLADRPSGLPPQAVPGIPFLSSAREGGQIANSQGQQGRFLGPTVEGLWGVRMQSLLEVLGTPWHKMGVLSRRCGICHGLFLPL